jgi:thiamine pyrophosphate-dependent acetolactate synthase large subunit-like protein
MQPTVRDATFDVLRRLELTTIFSNPGSTEVPFLTGLPEDLTFVLGLHEGSVVSMASGFALGRGAPALALLHSMPGLGNCEARRIETHDALLDALEFGDRDAPLLLEVVVEQDETF